MFLFGVDERNIYVGGQEKQEHNSLCLMLFELGKMSRNFSCGFLAKDDYLLVHFSKAVHGRV